MPYLNRCALAAVLATLAATVIGCGGAGAPPPGSPATPAPQPGGLATLPDPVPGLQMPFADPVDFDFDNLDKGTSAVYKIFFRDSVNEASGGRWTVLNNGGAKAWTLSNTFFSVPKAWVIGQNYWNVEDDWLTSNTFAVEDGTDGLALAFYARWNIASGDNGTVYYFDAFGAQQVVNFTAGSNPSYPGWDRYYFKLPANTSGNLVNSSIAFRLTSDNAGTAWGFGIDSAVVYQTQLGTPLGLTATDGDFLGQVDLGWTVNQVGTLLPDGYEIYRAPDVNGAPGTYALLNSTTNNSFSDLTNNASQYWYKVLAYKSGWPDSAESNEDSGHGGGTFSNLAIGGGNVEGTWNSLAALASGSPAISYREEAPGGDLMYAYSSSSDGSSGWTWRSIDTTGDTGWFTSLALNGSGNPAIAYYDNSNADLKYAYSDNADGSGTWTIVTVDSLNITGQRPSLALINGFPAISYYYNQDTDLRYAYSSQADGSSGWTIVDVDTAGFVGQYNSLAEINGFPAISYFDETNFDLKYAYSTQPDGSADWTSLIVDATGDTGYFNSLEEVNGFPAISYKDHNTFDLNYAYSSLADGSGGWTSVVVDAANDAGDYSSLAVVYGKPAISYFNSTFGELRYAFSSVSDGSAGWSNTVVDGTAGGQYSSLAAIDGKPGISYYHATDSALKYAWLQ